MYLLSRGLFAIATLSAISISLRCQPLFACEGTTTIFEDEFRDDSGGWSFAPAIRVENSSLVVVAPANNVLKSLNIANTVKKADICVETTFKDAPTSKIPVSAGLMFWSTDFNNYYSLQIQVNGAVGIWRYQSGTWLGLRQNTEDSSVKKGQGEVNTLRVKASDKIVSLFVNGVLIREIRAEPPSPNWHFGLYGSGTSDREATTIFKHFKVTTVD